MCTLHYCVHAANAWQYHHKVKTIQVIQPTKYMQTAAIMQSHCHHLAAGQGIPLCSHCHAIHSHGTHTASSAILLQQCSISSVSVWYQLSISSVSAQHQHCNNITTPAPYLAGAHPPCNCTVPTRYSHSTMVFPSTKCEYHALFTLCPHFNRTHPCLHTPIQHRHRSFQCSVLRAFKWSHGCM
jgi:hypothetical protein